MDREKILNVFFYLFIFLTTATTNVSRTLSAAIENEKKGTEDRPRVLCYANFTMNNDFQKKK